MNKTIIRKRFSRFAAQYDQYAAAQRYAAEKLIGEFIWYSPRSILEIGCGTGIYTRLLRQKFSQAYICAIDLSEEMLKVAQEKFKKNGGDIDFIRGDGESLCFEQKFDCITSNACFQWFLNLDETLAYYKEILVSPGRIYFSLFGPETFGELAVCLKELGVKTSISAEKFLPLEDIKEITGKHFQIISLREFKMSCNYLTITDLFKSIRFGTGIYYGERKTLWTSQLLEKLENLYRDRYKEITATYQVFLCVGGK